MSSRREGDEPVRSAGERRRPPKPGARRRGARLDVEANTSRLSRRIPARRARRVATQRFHPAVPHFLQR